ncbi:hypothetical protein [Niabella drilacis]|uniref:Uncharacterized protein n=1 Tax=Niabella drilacis (strain DSM 25811 / CCM 8410 / CCUG 62505 / LMG 26954 / E90) TaxID=1285928 RepID=A0A1G7A4F1_NIADE|nr:hypothetical protein [Niabella drilacis]SDE09719.1 hypothetical protein SAMN04487894_1214 [Niabella drilacis]
MYSDLFLQSDRLPQHRTRPAISCGRISLIPFHFLFKPENSRPSPHKNTATILALLLSVGAFAQTDISVTAYRKAQHVYIKWNSSCEKNCREYKIEGFTNSNSWETIGTVNSRTSHGNSDTPLGYAFSMADTAVALAGIAFLFLLLLIPNASGRNVRWLLGIALTAGFATCSGKIADAINTGRRIQYVRLLQYNTDGRITASKMVQLTQE